MKPPFSLSTSDFSLESLESRIAPAGLNESGFEAGVFATDLVLTAGQGISTSKPGGSYLLYVEKGMALVTLTDLNQNGQVDFNEVTGISAGDGLRLISFVSIYGDIVTNLQPDGQLTDSDLSTPYRDGRVLLDSTIEKIELRSVRASDLDPGIDGNIVANRLAMSSYSIYGNIYAGGGMGVAGGGIIIDDTGRADQAAKYQGGTGADLYRGGFISQIGDIKVGTAASGEYFNFNKEQLALGGVAGDLRPFSPLNGKAGGDIIGIKSVTGAQFNIGDLQAGDGGFGARGGNIQDVALGGDMSGGYSIIAGNGGNGTSGGDGGSIINFSDNGSITSQVFIQAGDGGRGLGGAGGDGGGASFGAMNMAARLSIQLGSGGDGLTKGGDGRALTSGQFLVSDPGFPKTLSIVSQTRNWSPTDTDYLDFDLTIGTTVQADFNRDGRGDFIYSAIKPNQIVVMIAEQTSINDVTPSGITYRSFYLNGPVDPGSIAIADMNNDGLLDVIAASSNIAAADGVYVFLNKGTDGDGMLSNGLENMSFASPRITPVPFVQDYDLDGNIDFFRSYMKVITLAVGDFDGDHIMDVAVGLNLRYLGDGGDKSGILIMRGATTISQAGTPELTGSGFFYSDFVHDRPFVYSGTGVSKFAPPATKIASTVAAVGGTVDDIVAVYENNPLVYSEIFNQTIPLSPTGAFGGDLTFSTGAPPGFSPNDVIVLDFDDDGRADRIESTSLGDIRGFLGVPGAAKYVGTVVTGITGGIPDIFRMGVTAADADGVVNDLALHTATTQVDGNQRSFITASHYTGSGFTTVYSQADVAIILDETLGAFAPYDLDTLTPQALQYVHATPTSSNSDQINIVVGALVDLGSNVFTHEIGVFKVAQFAVNILGGNGGDGKIGPGGSGGSLGKSLKTVVDPETGIKDIVGSVSIVLPANPSFRAAVTMVGGTGGEGFTVGGAGGSITGLTVRYSADALVYSSSVYFQAGNGGASTIGAGGKGGDLLAVSAQTGLIYIAGNGGDGLIGGAGGSVVGSKTASVYESETARAVVWAGNGGYGLSRGGAGGSISNFKAKFLPIVQGEGGLLQYFAGNGGDSTSGAGGAGGSIISSSPFKTVNNLAGPIELRAGYGGDGLTGGAGGSIKDFVNSPTASARPSVLTALAGNGGMGSFGVAGAGGSITGLSVSADGKEDNIRIFKGVHPDSIANALLSYLDPDANPLYAEEASYAMNRVVAGNGGNSYGDSGGAGGSVSSTNIASIEVVPVSAVITAGAGGTGITKGGAGGTITKVSAGVGGNLSNKVLVIAGAGGSAYAALPADIAAIPSAPTALETLKAFGLSSGVGGNGGSIIGFSQEIATQANVDLIAGNGGSILNYSTEDPNRVTVGKGGSIQDVVVTGNIGNSNLEASGADLVPIKAYNNIFAGETLADFIARVILLRADTALTDADGNVGLVAGSAGRVMGGDPSSYGTNGSVSNLRAKSIMSMVAGSVDRISAIQQISKIFIDPIGNIPGDDKGLPNVKEYLWYDGVTHTTPQLGGRLIDGAVIVRVNNSTLVSDRLFASLTGS